jgi:hypothetical protein
MSNTLVYRGYYLLQRTTDNRLHHLCYESIALVLHSRHAQSRYSKILPKQSQQTIFSHAREQSRNLGVCIGLCSEKN